MAHVICQVLDQSDRVTFTWSEGAGSFDPYALTGQSLINFRKGAESARGRLSDLVEDYLHGTEEDIRRASYELARAGRRLHELIFRPDAGPSGRTARIVRRWLDSMFEQEAIDCLELVLDGPLSFPWNVVYEGEPDEAAFLSERADARHWREFWGIRYNLAINRRVEPLRRLPLLRDPKVLLVVDPTTRDGLPEDQRGRLLALSESRRLPMVHRRDDLARALRQGRPDLIYWLCHADPTALIVDGEPIGPNDLLEMLRGEDECVGGIAFLNACQTAEPGEQGSFLDALREVGLSGVIATEQQTVDTFANPLGLDFLEAFLDTGEPIGRLLQGLRGRVPLGLLYSTYCPPHIRVARPTDCGGQQPSQIEAREHLPGLSLGPATGPCRWPSLPDEPYPSLHCYDRSGRALFAGRDRDVERFARLLDEPGTRVLILHGESGVGKSSFLRAGVIPYLEEECVGYRLVRDRTGDDDCCPVLFVRATQDLAGQLARALAHFCARPFRYPSPRGEAVAVDLPSIMARVSGADAPESLRAALRADASLLGRLLSAIAASLPFAPVMVVDQGEEVFTLAQGARDDEERRVALEMLRRAAGTPGNFRTIVSLRTEYHGRLIDRLRRGLKTPDGVREYFLADFEAGDLLDAIRRPTLDEPIRFASEIPARKYGFRYAEGVAEAIVADVLTLGSRRRDSMLPLVQVVCTLLSEVARTRPDPTIGPADLRAIGSVEGGLRRHVTTLVARIFARQPSDVTAFQVLFTRLYLPQLGGSPTTALVPEDDLARHWRGRTPFALMLGSAVEQKLLRVESLRIGGGEERRYVSLGHDALAKVAADWDRELRHRRRLRDLRRGIAAGAVVLVGMTWVALCDHYERSRRLARRGFEIRLGIVRGNELLKRGELSEARQTAKDLLTDFPAEPGLASLRGRVLSLLERAERGLRDKVDYIRFIRARDDAIFHATYFTGLGLSDDVEKTRRSARNALGVFADRSCKERWALRPLTDWALSQEERVAVVEGCHELLLIWAEALAHPLPKTEHVRQQTDEALKVLDLIRELPPPSRLSQIYHLRRAEYLRRRGDAAGSDRERVAAERLRPDRAFEHFGAGRESYGRHRWNEAICHFEDALRQRPGHFWARCLLAICELQTDRPAEAKIHLGDCLARHRDYAWLYLLRAHAHGQAGVLDFERAKGLVGREAAAARSAADSSRDVAEADYREATRLLGPEAEELRYVLSVNRSLMRLQFSDLHGSIADLREAIRLQPRRFNAYSLLALALQQDGQRERALDLLTRALELTPDRIFLSPLHRTRALVHLKFGDLVSAVGDLEEACRYDPPDDPNAARDHARRGELLYRLGRFRESLDACESALKLDPNLPEAHRWRVAALLGLGRHDEVIASCDRYLEVERPAAAEFHEIRGLALARGQDFAGAIRDYSAALALRPVRPGGPVDDRSWASTLHAERGWAYTLCGSPRVAADDFTEAIRLDPSNADAYNGRGSARLQLGEHRSAINDANAALALAGSAARTWYIAARTYAQAADATAGGPRRRPTLSPREVSVYRDLATRLLRQALARVPAEERAAFWRDSILSDPAFRSLRRIHQSFLLDRPSGVGGSTR